MRVLKMEGLAQVGAPTAPAWLLPLLDQLAEGVMLLDGDGAVIDCNTAAERMLGTHRDDMAGRIVPDHRWAAIREDGTPVTSDDFGVLAGALPRKRVIGVRQPGGRRVWLELTSRGLAEASPEGTATLVTLADLTAQRCPGAGPEQGARQIRDFAELAPVPMWLATADGRRTYFNARWRSYVGGISEDPGDDWRDAVHPDDLPAIDAARSSMAHGAGPATYEFRLRDSRGRYRWFSEHVSHWHDADGEPAGYIGLAVDIDSCRSNVGRIRTLSRAVEQSAARIVITDAEGRIEYVNPACCTAYGYSAAELIGENPRIFKSGQTPAERYKDLWKTVTAGETWRGEITNRARDGHLLIETVTISPIRDDAGNTRHYVAVKEDITALRNAMTTQRDLDARLGRLERMRTVNTLAGGIAHEFNNILVAILGFSDLGIRLLQGDPDPEKVTRYLEEIRSAGERARALVGRLRAFGRTTHLQVKAVMVQKVILEASELLSSCLPSGLTVVVQTEPDLPAVQADESALQQVLMNVGLNARDAMPGGGRIRIEASRRLLTVPLTCDSCHETFAGEYVVIEISDNGPGIAEAIKANIFEPFFTTKDVGIGSGLGLAIVHGTLHQFDAHVVIGRAPRGGARVGLYLPVRPPTSEPRDD